MNILLVTAAERVSDSGLYRSQVIGLAREFAKISRSTSVLSFTPIINTDFLSKRLAYWSYIKKIVGICRSSRFILYVLFLPYSSHSQFFGKAVILALWDNILVLKLIRACLLRLSPDIISCRGLLASYLVCKALRRHKKCVVNYDLRGNSSVEASLLYAANRRHKDRIKRLEQFVFEHCDSVTTVSEVLARQCDVPPHKLYITRIASSMPLEGKNKPPFDLHEGQTYFLTIGSISKSWYPMEEFARVLKSIHLSLENAANIVLAPSSCHTAIMNSNDYKSLRISTLKAFSTEDQAAEMARQCLFGLLPHRQPLAHEADLIKLAATVMSTKLSDYILLGIIPIVPQWCTAAAEFVTSRQIGFVYDSSYSFDFLQDSSISKKVNLYRSNINALRQEFASCSIARNQLQHFTKYLK